MERSLPHLSPGAPSAPRSGPGTSVDKAPKGTPAMLIALLKRQLKAYRPVLWLVVAFQGVQSVAGLWLPTLNADIIDNGVAKGDTGYIWRIGAVMVAASLVQLVFSVAAVKVGSKAAMGFGRDTRRDLFHQVNDFSSREVNQFGPPSLITRITNDVQQVQMLVLMTCTLLLAAPFTALCAGSAINSG